jgi:predicted nucleic acid-binding protein
MPLRILIDLNVLVDALNRREPFFETSAEVLAAAETGKFEGWIAAHSVTTLFYLIAKDTSHVAARVHLMKLIQFLKIAPIDGRVIEQALALPYKDFEDAVQMLAGVHTGLEYVVTRNPADFKAGPLPVLTPGEALALLQE